MKRWLVIPSPRPEARRRLVVFPHAGGSASFYRHWDGHLPSDVELQIVQYPGRETRFGEPVPPSLIALAGAAAAALQDPGHRRPETVLFGHSMGAAVAYEAALALDRRGERGLAELFVSCRAAPGTRPRGGIPQTEKSIVRSVRELGGTPPEIVDDPQYRALMVNILRQDYRLNGSYRRAALVPLSIPITAISSRDDWTVPDEVVEPWRACTSGRFRREIFDGGHFYLVQRLAQVIALVVAGARSELPG